MFRKIIILSISLFTFVTQAQPCTQTVLSQKALQSALYLELLNNGKPLSKELYSLNSQFDTYVAVFRYSGIQSLWKIKVNSRSCIVESVTKTQ